MSSREFDAVVVGAGPNGLTAAVVLAQAGWRVLVVEANDVIGGGTRTEELTLPGFRHDVCSAVHPLAVASLAFESLRLEAHGLRWVHPEVPLAHPLDGGRAAVLRRDVAATGRDLGPDGHEYERLMGSLVRRGPRLVDGVLAPLWLPPADPRGLALLGWLGVGSAARFARSRFGTEQGRALFVGCAAHSMLALDAPVTAAYGLVLGLLAHQVGWPLAEGGSASIGAALAAVLAERGGVVVTGHRIGSIDELPPARAVLLDLTPRQVVAMAGHRLPPGYRRRLARHRYGAGVFKVDWALDAPIPWSAAACSSSGTVHVGGGLDEVVAAEGEVARGRHPERPFVLLAQPSLFDSTRAPAGRHTAWAYCHVPNGSTVDMTTAIEAQVERFAPGFRDRVLGRHVMGPAAMESHDANYVGGDINGGSGDIRQLWARPVLARHPWATPVRGLYLCSSSTPPGGGVHGMCGWHAARTVLRDAERRILAIGPRHGPIA